MKISRDSPWSHAVHAPRLAPAISSAVKDLGVNPTSYVSVQQSKTEPSFRRHPVQETDNSPAFQSMDTARSREEHRLILFSEVSAAPNLKRLSHLSNNPDPFAISTRLIQ